MSKTKKLLEMIGASRRRWCCWNAMALGQTIEWYKQAIYIPGVYREEAAKDFARIALSNFMEMYELDFDCANMVFESCKYDIAEMLKTLGSEGERFHYMFSFTREKHPH